MLGRLRKGKLLGQELELERDISAFHEVVEVLVTAGTVHPEPLSVHAATGRVAIAAPGDTRADGSGGDDIQRIIDLSATAPRSALLRLAESLERDIRVFAHATAAPTQADFIPPREAAALLVRSGLLPAAIGDSLTRFWGLRSTLIHSVKGSESSLFRTIDAGLELLRAIRRIPAELVAVLEPEFPVYHDEGCTREFVDIKGISLQYQSPGMEMVRIWGVAKERVFSRGVYVTKEWDCTRKHGPAWYVDSVSSTRKQAWTGICEFVGRPIAGL